MKNPFQILRSQFSKFIHFLKGVFFFCGYCVFSLGFLNKNPFYYNKFIFVFFCFAIAPVYPSAVHAISTEEFIHQLRDKGHLKDLSDSTLSVFRSSCSSVEEMDLNNGPKLICETVVNSDICKGVESDDLIDCSDISESTDFNFIEFFAGCAEGLFDSVTELIAFVWDVLKWVWNSVTKPGETYQEASEYIESVKNYLVNEYDKAYDASDSWSSMGKRVDAASAVAYSIARMLFQGISDFLYKEYQEFGCLNFQARTQTICKVAGEIIIPPVGALALIKGGAKAVKITDQLQSFIKNKKDGMSFERRKKLGESSLNRSLTDSQVKALEKAHLFGKGQVGKNGKPAGIGNYTLAQLREKHKILKSAGFSDTEIRKLMGDGVVGTSSGFKRLFQKKTHLEASGNVYVDAFRGAFNSGKIEGDNLYVSYTGPGGEQIYGKVLSSGKNKITVEKLDGSTQDITGKKLNEVSQSPAARQVFVNNRNNIARNNPGDGELDFRSPLPDASPSFKPPLRFQDPYNKHHQITKSAYQKAKTASDIFKRKFMFFEDLRLNNGGRIRPLYQRTKYWSYYYGNEFSSVNRDVLPAQGWKFHVSAKPENLGIIIEEILPVLQKNNIPHKVISPDAFGEYIKKTGTSNTQQGKFITVYPQDTKQAKEYARILQTAMQRAGLTSKDDFLNIPGEPEVAPGIFARYGEMNSENNIIDSQGKKIKIPPDTIYDPVKREIVQDMRGGEIPEFALGELELIIKNLSPHRSPRPQRVKTEQDFKVGQEVSVPRTGGGFSGGVIHEIKGDMAKVYFYDNGSRYYKELSLFRLLEASRQRGVPIFRQPSLELLEDKKYEAYDRFRRVFNQQDISGDDRYISFPYGEERIPGKVVDFNDGQIKVMMEENGGVQYVSLSGRDLLDVRVSDNAKKYWQYQLELSGDKRYEAYDRFRRAFNQQDISGDDRYISFPYGEGRIRGKVVDFNDEQIKVNIHKEDGGIKSVVLEGKELLGVYISPSKRWGAVSRRREGYQFTNRRTDGHLFRIESDYQFSDQRYDDYRSRVSRDVIQINHSSPNLQKWMKNAVDTIYARTGIKKPEPGQVLSERDKHRIYRVWLDDIVKRVEDKSASFYGGKKRAKYGQARNDFVRSHGGVTDLGDILEGEMAVCRELSIFGSVLFSEYGIKSKVVTGKTHTRTNPGSEGRHAWIEVYDKSGLHEVIDSNNSRAVHRDHSDYEKWMQGIEYHSAIDLEV